MEIKKAPVAPEPFSTTKTPNKLFFQICSVNYQAKAFLATVNSAETVVRVFWQEEAISTPKGCRRIV